MAPYDSGRATTISPLIDSQVPDFVQADHSLFVKFLEHYYKFLESAQLTISGTVNFVALETVSSNILILNATDYESSNAGEKIVLESGAGTTGKFEIGETLQVVHQKQPQRYWLTITQYSIHLQIKSS